MKETAINCKKFGTVYMDENCGVCDSKVSYDPKKRILDCEFIGEIEKC